MFRDTKEELQRLEQELWREEAREEQDEDTSDDEEEPEEEYDDEIEGYVNQEVHCKVYNADRTDVDMEEFSRQVREPEKSLTGWIVLVFLLMTGLVCVMGYWVLRFLGVLG